MGTGWRHDGALPPLIGCSWRGNMSLGSEGGIKQKGAGT